MFPFALSLLGILLIAAGIGYQRYGKRLEGGLQRLVPPALASLQPGKRAGAVERLSRGPENCREPVRSFR